MLIICYFQFTMGKSIKSKLKRKNRAILRKKYEKKEIVKLKAMASTFKEKQEEIKEMVKGKFIINLKIVIQEKKRNLNNSLSYFYVISKIH